MKTSLLLSILVFAGTARAEEAAGDAEAKRRAAGLLDEGNRLFAKKSYPEALARYEAAHAAFPSYKILFNLAEAHRELGHYALAVDSYERFLEKGGAAKGSAARVAAENALAEIRPKVGYIVVEGAPAGVAINVDGKPRATAPAPPIAVDPGTHDVEALVPTGPVTAKLEVARGARVRFSVGPDLHGPPPAAAIAPPGPALVAENAPAREGGTPAILGKWWLWAAVGVVALTATGVAIAAGTGGTDFVPHGELAASSTAQWERF